MTHYTIGIAGATGAVGTEVIGVLHKRKFPVKELKLFGSSRSAGTKMDTPYGPQAVAAFDVSEAAKCDVVFLCVSGEFSKQYAVELAQHCIVIDNSSAFRYDDNVPLVVPEINAAAINGAKLIANPNCTTAIASVVLWPLHQAFTIKKIIMSTYQASSGAGAKGMDELLAGAAQHLAGGTTANEIFAHPLAFNIIPHIDAFQENGYTKEEMKVAWETHKIFGDKDIAISCTCVRVPTLRVHAESITIETEKPITADAARRILSTAPGVKLADDIGEKIYPMPVTATEQYDVEVGRIRQSLVFGPHGLDLFVAGDQLLKGAALNAVQIAESILTP